MFAFDHPITRIITKRCLLGPSNEVIFPLNVGHQSGIDVNGKDCTHEGARGTGERNWSENISQAV